MELRLHVPVPASERGPEYLDLDMASRPRTEELITQLARHSRIPLEEVKRHPGGGVFTTPETYVEAGDPGCPDRVQLADPDMMAELDQALVAARDPGAQWPYRLICRRMMHVYNSMGTVGPQPRSRRYNPAFMNPADLDRLALVEGDVVTISSRLDSIIAVVHPDDTLREGIVSMAFGFGGAPDRDGEYITLGSNTNRLIDNDIDFDQWSGQPRMSDVPVAVTPHRSATSELLLLSCIAAVDRDRCSS
jgi:anaerobic selenocysteine-containing dehydrogenase